MVLTDHLPTRGYVAPPYGWMDLIRRKPKFLRRGIRPTVMEWDTTTSVAVLRAKRAIDQDFLYEADGKKDTWTLPEKEFRVGVLGKGRWVWPGDCEDCANLMIKDDVLPIPAGAKRRILCKIGARGHLVVGIWTTDKGTLILDLQRPIVHWRQTGLNFATDGAVEILGWPIWGRIVIK